MVAQLDEGVVEGLLPPLTPAQFLIATSPARYKIVCTSRRLGKTLAGVVLSARKAANDNGICWWIAPDNKRLMPGLRVMKTLMKKLKPYGVRHRIEPETRTHTFLFPSGGEVHFRNASDPEQLRGDALDLAVFDEFAFMNPDNWEYSVQPMLVDRRGDAIFFSSPHGRNHLYDMYQNCGYYLESDGTGQANWKAHINKNGDERYMGFRFTVYDNPTLPIDEVEYIRAHTASAVWRQEWMAEFLDETTGVFKGIEAAATGMVKPPQLGHTYVMGVDLARHEDFTVVVIIDVTDHSMVYMERAPHVLYADQRRMMGRIYDLYHPAGVWVERNREESYIEQLREDGIPAQGFLTNGSSKPVIIEALQLAIETRALEILNDPILLDELQSYEVEILDSGHARYGSPRNKHDDCVIALAIAWYGAVQATLRLAPSLTRGRMPIYGSDSSNRRRQYGGYRERGNREYPH